MVGGQLAPPSPCVPPMPGKCQTPLCPSVPLEGDAARFDAYAALNQGVLAGRQGLPLELTCMLWGAIPVTRRGLSAHISCVPGVATAATAAVSGHVELLWPSFV